MEGNVFKRPVRYARLMMQNHMIPADIIAPLFEPTIIKMTTQQMTLVGYQIGSREGAPVHYMQSWAVRMTATGESH